MTREEVIGMAEQAGFTQNHGTLLWKHLNRFADLVIENERKRIAADVYNALLEMGEPEGVRKVAVDAVYAKAELNRD